MNSLCIPRAMAFTQAYEVENVFNQLFGKAVVDHIDERETVDTRGQTFKTFYIHFEEDVPMTRAMVQFYEKLEKEGVVQVMTGKAKWFWKVYNNHSPKVKKPEPTRVGPRIMTEEDEQAYIQWKQSRVQTLEVFTEEELDILDEATNPEDPFLEEYEAEELDEECEYDELMEIADEMAKE